MTEKSQGLVRDWLLQTGREKQLSNWPDTFKSLFDAVFTENHFSWECFYRSALASAIIVTIFLLGKVGFGTATFRKVALSGWTDSIFLGVLYSFGLAIVMNSVVDYVSLFQTRWIIEYMAETRSTAAHLGFLVLDAVLTTAIFVLIASATIVTLSVTGGQLEDTTIWQAFFLLAPEYIYDSILEGDPGRAIFFSTFLTSVWIWLYVLAGVTMRGTLSLFRGVDWMSDFFDAENRPVQALGLMLAILTTAGFLLSAPFVL